METKRFLGNDMSRIFVRVRKELGPDAVIVSTRSLMREGAEPLIEVLAAPAGTEAEVSVAMQRSIVQGLLARVETSSRGLTIGDLEDLAAREREARGGLPEPLPAPAPPVAPEWLEGFVPAPPQPAFASFEDDAEMVPAFERTEDAIEPFDAPKVTPPPPMEFRPRPRIVTRPRTDPAETPLTPAAEVSTRFAPVSPGVAGTLLALGFSAEAANAVSTRHPELTDPEQALAELLASREANYPVEGRTAIITIQGAPGSGRTTALMRMALDCADSGRPAVLVAADLARTGGREQVHAYGEAIGVDVYDVFTPQDLVHAVTQAPKGACIFVDVPAGRWMPPPIPGVQHFSYAAIPAHWNAAVVARELPSTSCCAGVVITCSDLATDLIPAISLVVETGLGLAFLTSGRDVATGIDVADPLTLASGVFTTSTRETTNGRLFATA